MNLRTEPTIILSLIASLISLVIGHLEEGLTLVDAMRAALPAAMGLLIRQFVYSPATVEKIAKDYDGDERVHPSHG